SRRGCRRVGGGPALIALLPVAAGRHRPRTRQRRLHGRHHAVPVDLIPSGVLGVGAGFWLYARERRRCDRLGCRMAGSRLTLALLVLAGLVVATSIILDRFPEMTSDLVSRLIDTSAPS